MLRPGANAPAALPGVIARASLFARLSAAAPGVTLLSAPAGSGKTVLLRSWIAAEGLGARTAWVTVDRGEHDPQRLWLQVVDALRSVHGAEDAVERRTPTPEFDGEAFVSRLIAELEALGEPLLLVLDDLHELVSAEAQLQLERLLARRPPTVRVILASRHDPQLGLHRLRLAGELTELRGADLRFTAAETAELLAAASIDVSEESAALLQARTEGWAAGLRLAALSLAGRPDPERFVAEFSGSDRIVADYLLAEVLGNQPEEVRTLLLRTSILGRVCGALADRLLSASGSERILLRLEESNAFVTSVDATRTWFRYHQLFADLLRLELRRTSPELLPTLHRAAAGWYVERNEIVDAVRHLQAAEDWPGASELLATHGVSLILDGKAATIDTMLAAFPGEAALHPRLLSLIAYRELSERSLDTAAELLALAGRAAEKGPHDPRAELALALSRLGLARRRGDLETTLREVRPFLEPLEARTPSELVLGGDARALALMNLAIVELWSSRLADAQRHLEQGLTLAREIGRPFVEIACLAHLSLIASTRSFAPARMRADEALHLAEAHGWATDPVTGVALASMALMDVAQGRFADARARVERAAPLLKDEVDPGGAMLLHFLQGDLLAGEGRLGEAIEAYRAAERLQPVLATRHILTAPAQQSVALTQLRAGDTAAARVTLDEAPADEWNAGEARLATAALRLAEDAPADAIATVQDLVTGHVPVLRVGTTIQALVVAAAAHDRLGHASAVEELLERALDLAEPDGLVFSFLATPAPGLAGLLERHPRHRTAHAALLSDLIDILAGVAPASGASRLEASRAAPLVEELSSTELRVLRYLPSNLSASEIAAELYVSTSTVKTHMRHIYDKLDVHRRTEAVERARRLGLLGPSTPRRA